MRKVYNPWRFGVGDPDGLPEKIGPTPEKPYLDTFCKELRRVFQTLNYLTQKSI